MKNLRCANEIHIGAEERRSFLLDWGHKARDHDRDGVGGYRVCLGGYLQDSVAKEHAGTMGVCWRSLQGNASGDLVVNGLGSDRVGGRMQAYSRDGESGQELKLY